MVFNLVEGARKTWRRLDAHNQVPKIIDVVEFADRRDVIANLSDPHFQTAAA
jgi:hypothetical protein